MGFELSKLVAVRIQLVSDINHSLDSTLKERGRNQYQALPKQPVNPSLTHTEADGKISVFDPKLRDFEIFKITYTSLSKYHFTVVMYYAFRNKKKDKQKNPTPLCDKLKIPDSATDLS